MKIYKQPRRKMGRINNLFRKTRENKILGAREQKGSQRD